MNKSKISLLIILLFIAAPLFVNAHFTWILPAEKERSVLIGHGHSFPHSEQAVALEGLQVVLQGSGAKTIPVQAERREKDVAAHIPAEIKELAAAGFQMAADIITRTTTGVKRGPMNAFTGVTDSFRRLRSGYFQSAPGVELPVVADRLLLQAENRDGRMQFLLRLGAEPLAGVAVRMVASGQEEGTEIGVTDAAGRLFFKPEKTGLHLFSVDYSRQVKHDEYLREQFAATLALQLK